MNGEFPETRFFDPFQETLPLAERLMKILGLFGIREVADPSRIPLRSVCQS
jgi:hypothetical protein